MRTEPSGTAKILKMKDCSVLVIHDEQENNYSVGLVSGSGFEYKHISEGLYNSLLKELSGQTGTHKIL
ncbi:hypothetical protein [Paenibacillus tianjinensis]|uniref:Uncharacterized protein n=1 Tax=Paenibacillus tianjinensis TaxID=2810347 RepID=A0ABX7L5L8_9BACL|nr:hypothetical protein [Paenibacillus tianjinensis]QSF43358.1 hypothetical protein JRJ22_19015 [Paenibacillus tianjinensis]